MTTAVFDMSAPLEPVAVESFVARVATALRARDWVAFDAEALQILAIADALPDPEIARGVQRGVLALRELADDPAKLRALVETITAHMLSPDVAVAVRAGLDRAGLPAAPRTMRAELEGIVGGSAGRAKIVEIGARVRTMRARDPAAS